MKHFKRSIVAGAFLFVFSATQTFAMCTWGIVPPGRVYEPLDATEAFLSYDNGVQTLVLQPEFKGDAEDFAVIYPTPGKPTVIEGPKRLFDELNDATNPEIAWMTLDAVGVPTSIDTGVAEEKVVVVERKVVGEYDVAVLTATDATALVDWLTENEYNFTTSDSEKVDYYVTQGGYHFVALKVYQDVEDAEAERVLTAIDLSTLPTPTPFPESELEPIQISFATDRPQLPMRTLKSAMPMMTFDLYTLSDRAVYIPGVDTVWSNLIDANFLASAPTLNEYAPKGKWLVRQEIRFNPANSNEDLFLEIADTNEFEYADTKYDGTFAP